MGETVGVLVKAYIYRSPEIGDSLCFLVQKPLHDTHLLSAAAAASLIKGELLSIRALNSGTGCKSYQL